ncbi:hypothetical protein HY251_07885, partial [bacterium]|nr:hypothetical protein [bacterium]
MAQLLDFATHPEKPKDWHLYTLKELLLHVAEEKPSERQYTKWLRTRKIFDRRFLAFCERLLGIEKVPQKAPELTEVSRELLSALDKQKKKVEAEAERFLELHGYLTKFVLRELGDEFLAVTEMFRRIGTSAYVGRRPSMPQFEAWIRWLEWLGCLQKVGFRHKASPAGKEHGKYYREVPDAELTLPSREDELVLEPAPAASQEPGHAAPALVANAPTGRRTLEAREDESDDDDQDESSGLADEEGLDLPPQAAAPEPAPWAPPVEPYWANRPHDDAAAPRGPLPDPVLPAQALEPP